MCQTRRKHAALLYVREAIGRDHAFTKRFDELVRCSNSVLNREINPNAADWRHRVGSIPDAEKPGTIPLSQSIHPDAQELALLPIMQLANAIIAGLKSEATTAVCVACRALWIRKAIIAKYETIVANTNRNRKAPNLLTVARDRTTSVALCKLAPCIR